MATGGKRTAQVVTLKRLTGDDLPKAMQGDNPSELIYQNETMRIYTRMTAFKSKDVVPTEIQIAAFGDKPIWAEQGDHPARGGPRGAAKPTKASYTPAEIKEREDKLKKTADRLERMRKDLEHAKKHVDPNAPPAEKTEKTEKTEKKQDLPS